MEVKISPGLQEAIPPQGAGLENLPDMGNPSDLSKLASSSVKWV